MNRISNKSCLVLLAVAALGVFAGQTGRAQQVPQPSITLVGHRNQGSYVGVSVREIPEALATHLGLQAGRGVMVQTVIKDSPAAGAGIEKTDIILQADGKDISSAEELVAMILPKKPGQTVKLKIIHKGETVEKTIAVSDRPENMDTITGKRDPGEFPVVRGQDLKLLRGRVEVTPEGKIRIDFGDQEETEVSEEIQKLLKKGMQGASGLIGDSRSVIKAHEGGVLTVTKRADGKFEVIQTRPDGTPSTKVFDDLEALKEGDASAYDLYTHFLKNRSSGIEALGRIGDPKTRTEAMQELRELTQRFRQFEGKAADYPSLEEFRKLMKEKFPSEFLKNHSARTWGALGKGADGSAAAGKKALAELEKVRQRLEALNIAGSLGSKEPEVSRKFHVDADGKVTVQIQKDGSELTQSFQSLEEMKEQAPQLYEHYRKLLTAD